METISEISPVKRRLLVISYHFPPDGSIGGQRWSGLSKYLVRLGWEVHVVTAAAPGKGELPQGVHTHFRERRRTLNDLYRARFARPSTGAAAAVPATESVAEERRGAVAFILAAARRFLGSSLVLPDHGRGWVVRATLAARSLLRRHRFDCVVSSGPPHSAHFAGWLASIGNDVPFWIDMRDPWALTYEMNTPENAFIRAERRFLSMLERIVFPRASKVLVNTREFAEVLRETQPDLNVVHFPNGIDLEQLPVRDSGMVDTGRVVYVGTLYAGRNLSSVFSAMRGLSRNGVAGAESLRVSVAGPLESPHRERMQAEIAELELQQQVDVLGVLPREGALKLLGRAHLALVLAQEQPMCVPAKLYESVGLGVPTLVIAERDSAAAAEARRIGAFTVEAHDVDGIAALLSDMLTERVPKSIAAKTAISYRELAENMNRMLVEGSLESCLQPGVARASSLPHPV
jgi:glycosyltransferase involved in cell wall biosynthesis